MNSDRVTKSQTDDIQLPVTLEQVKAHLRITTDSEDETLRHYLQAAFDWAEQRTQRAIVSRNYLIVRDTFPGRCWALPLGRISAVVSVKYIDSDGDLQSWDASNYETDVSTDYNPRVRPSPANAWPSTGEYFNAAQCTVTAGWSQEDIPYTLRQAILLKCGELDEGRAPGDAEPDASVESAERMIASWTLPPWG